MGLHVRCQWKNASQARREHGKGRKILIGWIALSSTRLGWKRGEDGLSLTSSSPPSRINVVALACGRSNSALPAGRPPTGPWLQFLRKHSNARVDDSAEHCSDSYQGDISLQKSDQKKSS